MAAALCGPLIGGVRLISWAFAETCYLMGSIVAATAVSAYAGSGGLRRTELVSTPVYTLGCVICASVPAMPVLLAGCMCLWLFAARDSAASRHSRLLPGHAADLAHPVGCGIAMTFILCLCMMSFTVYGPILLIRLYALTPLEAGFVVVTESLGWSAGAFFLSGLAPAQEGGLIRIGGSAMLLASIATQAWFVPHGPLWLVVVSAFIGNAGIGMIWGYIVKIVIANAGREDRDRAGALLPSAQQTAFAFGAALSGVIANGLGFDQMTQPEEFRMAAFWVFAGFVPPALLGCLVAWRFSALVADDRRPPPHGQ